MTKSVKISLLLIVLGLFVTCGTRKTESHQYGKNLATFQHDFLDYTVRPKDNFYRFANGNWLNSNTLPKTKSSWNTQNDLEVILFKKLSKIIEKATDSSNTDTSLELIKRFVASYHNQTERKKELDEIILLSHRLKEQIKRPLDIQTVSYDLLEKGIETFYEVTTETDVKKPTHQLLTFQPLSLRTEGIISAINSKERKEEYLTHITKCFNLLRFSEAKEIAERVFEIEKELFFITLKSLESNTYTNQLKVEINQAVKDYPFIDFKRFSTHLPKNSERYILLSNPEYFEQFHHFIKSNSIEDLGNYIIWKQFQNFLPYFPEEFQLVKETLKTSDSNLQNPAKAKELDKSILFETRVENEALIRTLLKTPLRSILIQKYEEEFGKEGTKSDIQQIANQILKQFKQEVPRLTWMDSKAKTIALKKLESLTFKIGTLSKIDTLDIQLSHDFLIKNIVSCNVYQFHSLFKKVAQPVNKNTSKIDALDLSIYYNPVLNVIEIPTAIMESPYYNKNAEQAVNYASIGVEIARTIIHSIDEIGSNWDENGTFISWWNDATRSAYTTQNQFIHKIYSSFCPFDSQCIDGSQTGIENSADLGGLRIAFRAYQNTKEVQQGKSIKSYTPNQRFFISYAQFYRTLSTHYSLKNELLSSSFSPAEFRILGSLKNCKEFHQAFGIKDGDNMWNENNLIPTLW